MEPLVIMLTVICVPFIAIAGIVIVGLRTLSSSKKNKSINEEEAQMMQDIYQGLEKMKKRVEALETLILEKDKKE